MAVRESGGSEVYGVHSECVESLSGLLNVIEDVIPLSDQFVSFTAGQATFVFNGKSWIPA